jgi:hypothetical protein
MKKACNLQEAGLSLTKASARSPEALMFAQKEDRRMTAGLAL